MVNYLTLNYSNFFFFVFSVSQNPHMKLFDVKIEGLALTLYSL